MEGFWWAEELPKKGRLWTLPGFADTSQDHTHYPLHLEGVPEVEGMRLIINRTCPVSKINDYRDQAEKPNFEINVEYFKSEADSEEATQLRLRSMPSSR